ncbi:DUF5329 family protein [Flavobacterium sp.]|uniref:DUF5329 family protein n=1 Tax=Flavobacterium sp. TaxID=239 RepID=UPI00374DEA3B
MRYSFLIFLALLLFGSAHAEPDAKAMIEIDHLFDYIKKSEVIFIRNGKEYPVADATKHIQSKFNHNKKKIKTAEDFIERSATKSEMSGDVYQIKLKDNSKVETGKWLLEELKVFREKQNIEEKKK